MTVTAALILFAITWFMVFFIVLPIRFKSQAQAGEVVPGTPKSAPADFMVGRKARITTLIALVIWAGLVWFILSGIVSVRDIDIMGRMTPAPVQQD
jgi:predicted secreted protein